MNTKDKIIDKANKYQSRVETGGLIIFLFGIFKIIVVLKSWFDGSFDMMTKLGYEIEIPYEIFIAIIYILFGYLINDLKKYRTWLILLLFLYSLFSNFAYFAYYNQPASPIKSAFTFYMLYLLYANFRLKRLKKRLSKK